VQQRVVAQVGRCRQRRAGGEQPGAADREHPGVHQQVGPETRPAAVAVADREIDVLALEVERRLARREAQLDAGLGGAEPAEPQHQPAGREGGLDAILRLNPAARQA
jgi:hypothetical protein